MVMVLIIHRSPLNQATTTMVDVAAAEIDQVNSRSMERLVANSYYGLTFYRAWIHQKQKRSMGRSSSINLCDQNSRTLKYLRCTES